MADDVEGFLHEHGLADATLIGHSMYASHPLQALIQIPYHHRAKDAR